MDIVHEPKAISTIESAVSKLQMHCSSSLKLLMKTAWPSNSSGQSNAFNLFHFLIPSSTALVKMVWQLLPSSSSHSSASRVPSEPATGIFFRIFKALLRDQGIVIMLFLLHF